MKFFTGIVFSALLGSSSGGCQSSNGDAGDVNAGAGGGGNAGEGSGGESAEPQGGGGSAGIAEGPIEEATAGQDGAAPVPGGQPGQDAGAGKDAAGGVAGPVVPAGLVPMFVAIGPGLRTTISCDDGLTWIENRFEKETDDDFSHDETNIHGAVFSNGRFYYPAGWGFSTTRVFASANGIDWERLYLGDAHQSNSMAAGGGVILFGEGNTIRRSADDGRIWTPGTLPNDYSHMRLAYGDFQGGRFVVGGRDNRHAYSVNGGRTWTQGQGEGGHRPVYGGGVFLSFQETGGSLVRSADGGATWQPVRCCGSPGYVAHVFWTGTRFLLFTGDGVWASSTGEQWDKQAGTGLGRFAAMARNPATGNVVAATGGRPVRFFRSTDGVRWTALADRSYDARGDEIKYITFGYGRPSARCPLR